MVSWISQTVRQASERATVDRLYSLSFTAVIGFLGCLALGFVGAQERHHSKASAPGATPVDFNVTVLPLMKKYCFACHNAAAKRGGLDLQRFTGVEQIRRDLKPWQGVVDHLQVGDMPPPTAPQPTAEEKRHIVSWVREFLDREGKANAGDPGYVPLRRLSNFEYDCTIRDLTGIDLKPAREFPADGAAGEGFTNAAEALTDISPALLTKYFNSAREIAEHAVLLPDGLRFSPAKTRRDWTDECTARLRAFYASQADPDGKLNFAPYVAATVKYRAELTAGKTSLDEVASREKLNGKYLRILWRAINDKSPAYPLDTIAAQWRGSTERDVPALTAAIAEWQAALWQTARIGSYVRSVGSGFTESTSRQVPVDPAPAASQQLRLAYKPAPGQSEVALALSSKEIGTGGPPGRIIWRQPRFESPGKPPLLLKDYAQYGPGLEVDCRAVFADTAQYLAAADEAARAGKIDLEELAQKHNLNLALLNRWISLLSLDSKSAVNSSTNPGRPVPIAALDLLDEPVLKSNNLAAINGWRRKGSDLPVIVTNSSGTLKHIPGDASPHGVMVHPTPTEFVAVVWTSPISGTVRIQSRIKHAHPACGNGVAWWLEQRRHGTAAMFAEGKLDLGQQATPGEMVRRVDAGDQILIAVDARDHDHSCDLTDISLKLSQVEAPGLTWDLAGDIADNVTQGNPHSDHNGNPAVWTFVKGPTRSVGGEPVQIIPTASVLGRWRTTVLARRTSQGGPNRSDPTDSTGQSGARGNQDVANLAAEAQKLLSGPRPGDNTPDRLLYDHLVAVNSALLEGIDTARLPRARAGAAGFGLPRDRFGAQSGAANEAASVTAAATSVTQIHLPAALLADREFVVDAALETSNDVRAAAVELSTSAVGSGALPGAKGRIVARPNSPAQRAVEQGFAQFRSLFPLYLCYPQVIPTDEVVNLKMFHREDDGLTRLFLSDAKARELEKLWREHRFVSRQPIRENAYLPLFIGFVTQDQPKEMVSFFEGQRPAFQKRSDQFEAEERAAVPGQLESLVDFATRAYRRPLSTKERTDVLGIYQSLRAKGSAHEEAFRGALARILVSPGFLFRIEGAPPGRAPAAVNDWELAVRLSYFIWSSQPDAELRNLAAAGKLHDPSVLAAQARRMLKDQRVRAMAIEFGSQWLQVRGFDQMQDKNERLFPTFDAELRKAINEETVLFFQDLFQADRPAHTILDSNATYLNETLAKHYGIPGVSGPQWRRVEEVRAYGRGGILGLASVQAKESGASRTSPTLRGNWIVETLLGEKLPRPPANVPKIPEEESGETLTVRQIVEKHARVPECAVCHVRIDPYGFALERYDPIGRFRTKDLGGHLVEAKANLKDGTEFEGIEGLRTYLLTKKRSVVFRLFCRRLLGYALGRSTAQSDQPLIDEMLQKIDRTDGRVSDAVLAIVQSKQFRMVSGRDRVR